MSVPEDNSSGQIRIWNRNKEREEIEQVYGDAGVSFLYQTKLGRFLAEAFLVRKIFSKFYGFFQSFFLSRFKIRRFVQDFKIPLEDFEGQPYRSFNAFFIRPFKPGKRTFVSTPSEMPAFAEGRYFAYRSVRSEEGVFVKGARLPLQGFLPDDVISRFEGGPLVIARLCPVDYHRFHFPDRGRVIKRVHQSGRLHSVNPKALQSYPEIFVTNERRLTLLETENFGQIAYVEVGALCVGRIVETLPKRETFERGEEKGYFLFGGSTVVIWGEPGAWRPHADLLERTSQKIETLVQLGDAIASNTFEK